MQVSVQSCGFQRIVSYHVFTMSVNPRVGRANREVRSSVPAVSQSFCPPVLND
jgi:hypothetical protein